MSSSFLKAEWCNLLMANYEIECSVLKKYLPCHTEIDDYNGKYYVSMVGFVFKNTRVLGLAIPCHQTFEEVNLRFYVRFKEGNAWRRGVVFIKEIVPKRMITFVANNLYGENYATHEMRHQWKKTDNNFYVSYDWKVNQQWNWIRANAEPLLNPIDEGSVEEFITEHYWGYTLIGKKCTGVYEVCHPRWQVHTVKDFDAHYAVKSLYGSEFEAALNGSPASVFLAGGSPVSVLKGTKLYLKQ